jgi:hypothetical protein
VRGTDHPASKSQPPRAKAPRGRDFARACHDGPIAIVRHAAVFFAFAAALSLTNCKEFVREMWERAMRAGIVAGCFALALLVSGCDSLDSRYQRYGIGTDLYWDGLPAATQLQDAYLAYICSQAISSTARSADAAICDGLTLGSRDWGLLVQAGMNDIDLRCDGYLAWLHDKRASREPILKQLAALGGATAAILRATDVGATPIALAGIAFGLAAETFTNIDLRLLNGVDYTTVQSVVRDNRTQFRISNLNLVIDNRPAAIYVLRNYLSICVPSSIEMSINNTINVYHRGGPEALRNTPVGLRAAPATSSTSAAVRGAPIRVDRPPPVTPLPVKLMQGSIGPVEGSISLSSGMALQRALCVPETGIFDAATRAQLRNFNIASLYPTDSAATDKLTTDADLARLRAAQRLYPSCQGSGFRNGFEEGLFARFGESKIRADLKLALQAAGLAVPEGLNATGAVGADNSIRQAVGSLRTKYNLAGQPVFDRTFYDTMLNNMAR